VLDLGCGSGVNSVFCAPKAREVVAVDISDQAVENTRENCRIHGLANVSVAKSDMFSNVQGRFDMIVANPPYVAADFEKEEEQFATSTRYLPQLFGHAAEHLTERGRLVIQFPMWFRKRIERLAAANNFKVVSVRRMPPKSLGLFLLSVAYLQVGFRSACYLLEPMPAARKPEQGSAKPVLGRGGVSRLVAGIDRATGSRFIRTAAAFRMILYAAIAEWDLRRPAKGHSGAEIRRAG
jgi:release factor glutamine methyltransferase